MRRLQILGVLGLAACVRLWHQGVQLTAEAGIISHDDGDEVKEATEVLFRGMGSDPDHGKTDLRPAGRWTVR